ncbi:unnamed protein product [Cylindrotheca closterium]|uniref:Uncharacterized protein n=1 Tax=Cylindrotheca closterium TaxID=2856 RepID=A0AAD2CS67_9STRA|nr:unnamed protein product [Cylindrotheca closterium]
MTSRHLRTQSQPRPRSSMNRVGQSFEAWENVSDNARSSSQLNDRRAKSSMRYESATRDSSRQRMRNRDPSPVTSSCGHISRASSAGRMRQGPASKNKERGGPIGRESPLRVRQDLSVEKNPRRIPPVTKAPSLQRVPSLQNTPSLQPASSSVSQEELQAEQRLQKAENKISGLLQELDELRFFQELEHKSPTKTPKKPQASSHNPGVPINIRALSPARGGGKLPPPPPSTTRTSKSNGGGLETYQPLSPRKIAKLDRNSLELECQTLVRKLQIIDREKQSQAAMIEMYEISMQEHDYDKKKIEKLEGELKKVSMELKRQLQNIQRGKELLVKEYEQRIQNSIRKLERIQDRADSFKVDLGVAKKEAEKWKQESQKWQMELQDRNDKLDDLKGNHLALEEQLTALREVNSGVVDKVEKKRSEIATLKKELVSARKAVDESKEARNERYEEKISELEQHLLLAKEGNSNLEAQCLQIKGVVTKRDKALDAASKLESDNVALISQLRSRVTDLERANQTRFEEGKRAAKVVENKRMQELVAARAKEAKDYECRLKAMQEQLRHQSDRHHAEIEETRKRNDENLSLMRDEVKDEIRRVEGDKVAQLDSELKVQKRSYEQMKADYAARVREHQEKAREVAADFQRKSEGYQSELERVSARMAELDRSSTQKDNEIIQLKESLVAAKKKLDNGMEKLEAKAKTEIHKSKQLLNQERKTFATTESSLQADIATLESEKAAMERKSNEQVEDLLQRINGMQRQLAETQSVFKENEEHKLRLQELKNALQATQNDLFSERCRNEEVESELRAELAKLEGKLKASESKSMAKRAQFKELEQQLDCMNSTQSKVGEEAESTIKRLTTRLDSVSALLDREKLSSNGKDATIRQLREEVMALQEKSQTFHMETSIKDMKREAQGFVLGSDRKEKQIEDLRQKVDCLETEKLRKESELSNLRQDYQDLSELLEEKLHSNLNNVELKRRERDLKPTANSRHSDLETRMKAEISSLKTKLHRSEEERDSLFSQLTHTKARHDSAVKDVEETRETCNGNADDTELKSSHIRDVVQRYTRVIADLETQLEEESHFRGELEDKLNSAREELKEKQDHTKELVHRHTKNAMQLESDLSRISMERDELESRLDLMTNGMVKERNEHNLNTKAKCTEEYVNLGSAAKEHEDYHDHLDRKEKQLKEMKQKIPELLADLDSRTRERDHYKAATMKSESELAKIKIQFDETIDQYVRQVSELEVRLKEKAKNDTFSRDNYETSRLESSRNDKNIREMSEAIKELESLLEVANCNKDTSRLKIETIARELDEKRARSTELEMEKIELESKLLTLSRAKDDLRSKVTELTSRVERKEREVREVTDRYNMHVMELESKLDQDSDAKHTLRHEIDKLKADSHALARDADARAKDMTRQLEARLESSARERDDIEKTLQKLTHEKSEVINALEGVINEVQNREDEIESLTEILQRRDEELQHAKIIATKALQSAKDIQKRYKEKEKDRHTDMMEKMDELHDSIGVLSSKNDSLQRKISMLERELRDRNIECRRLKDQLRQIDGGPLCTLDQRPIDETASISKARDDGSTYSQASFRSSASPNFLPSATPSFHQEGSEAIEDPFLEEGDYDMDADSFSPSNSPMPFHDHGDCNGFPSYQGRSFEEPANHEKIRGGAYESAATDTTSKQRIEQNALRNYVRQRFANR